MAALGLLPAALSRDVGAETSRPFATVIIGGLVTATLLTLFIVPVLYPWFEGEPPAPTPEDHHDTESTDHLETPAHVA
jgi:Cu/Ag efflux pump CusA